MIVEICAIVATIVFIVLALYIILTLKDLQKSFLRFQDIASKVETKIDPLGLETLRLLKNTNELTETIQEDLESFHPLCDSISNVGNALQSATKSLNGGYEIHHDEKKKQWQEKLENIIELAAAGVMLWQQIKKRR